jgi:hypothetical protein
MREKYEEVRTSQRKRRARQAREFLQESKKNTVVVFFRVSEQNTECVFF